jgi:hypothetical protein
VDASSARTTSTTITAWSWLQVEYNILDPDKDGDDA